MQWSMLALGLATGVVYGVWQANTTDFVTPTPFRLVAGICYYLCRVAIMIFYVATSAGGAYAAGVPQSSRTTSQPQIVFPRATRPGPHGASSKNVIVGPTENISLVANHLEVQAKSLNSLVTIAPGLALTKPVTISIAYISVPPETTGEPRPTAQIRRIAYIAIRGRDGEVKIHMDITQEPGVEAAFS
jgi:hypothetical protein